VATNIKYRATARDYQAHPPKKAFQAPQLEKIARVQYGYLSNLKKKNTPLRDI
jgi:hypothetical protein